MNLTELKDAEYNVSGLQGFTMSEALRFWKTKFETFKHFQKNVITHPGLSELEFFAAEVWDTIKPISVEEALLEKNMERRRVMFDCIGIVKLFNSIEPQLLDRQVISKKRCRWNQNNEPWEHKFEDVYELYRIEGTKLFGDEAQGQRAEPVFAVRCRCTTTNREYWIYIPLETALGRTRWSGLKDNPDAIRAIAWTIRIDVTHPKRIFRQGDIILVEESENSHTVEPYQLSKEQYLKLLFSET